MSDRRYDIVIFGATSFVGRILCHYLDQDDHAEGLSWAVAGRSADKLQALCAELSRPAEQIIADAGDDAALAELCQQTRTVISTVGPYALYGEPLVRACTNSGTDYCDLTGEAQWIRQMIKRYGDDAKASGARIVHCCGFDSIPSDLGVLFLQQQAQQRFGESCSSVRMGVKALKGGMSGGTVASMLNIVKEAAGDPELRKELANPYSLCADDYRPSARQHTVHSAEFNKDLNAWCAPFIMAAINTRVVQRSNAISNQAYGANFRYDEAVLTGSGMKGRLSAIAMAAGIGGFMLAAAVKPSRWLLEKVLPEPGEGPSPQAQQQGFYDLRFVGSTDGGSKLLTRVTGDRDPGYGSTAKMLAQAAICLTSDISREQCPGGFWTPATALGEPLLQRLQGKAGLTFEVLDD